MLTNKPKVVFADVETSRFRRKAHIPDYSPQTFEDFLSLTRRGSEAWAQSNYGRAHTGSQLYQLYSTLPMHQRRGQFNAPSSFIAPVAPQQQMAGTWITGGKQDFSKETKVFAAAEKHGFRKDLKTGVFFEANRPVTELPLANGGKLPLSRFETGEAAKTAQFLENLIFESKQQTVFFGAHKPMFDLSAIQDTVFKYPSLSAYQTTFADLHRAGRFGIQPTEKPYHHLLWKYGQDNPSWANIYLRDYSTGIRLTKPEQLYGVPGWAIQKQSELLGITREPLFRKQHETILSQLGIPGMAGHEATHDVEAFDRRLYGGFSRLNREADRIRRSKARPDYTQLLKKEFKNFEGTAEEFFTRLVGNHGNVDYFKRLAEAEKDLRGARPEFRNFEFLKPELKAGLKSHSHILAGALAAVFIYNLVRQDSRSRKTQISGMRDEGVSQFLRHQRTDFGSGYRADESRPTLSLAYGLGALAGAVALHRYKLANSSTYAENLYRFVKTVEYKSPLHILSTHRVSEMLSSYLPQRLVFEKSQLLHEVSGISKLTPRGDQFQKLFGSGVNLHALRGPLVFERAHRADPFLRVAESAGLDLSQFSVRFAEQGHIAGSAFRYRMPLDKAALFERSYRPPMPRLFGVRVPKPFQGMVRRFNAARLNQIPMQPKMLPSLGAGLDESSKIGFFPLYARKSTDSAAKQIAERASFFHFHLLERPLDLMARSLGLGLKQGTYNSSKQILGQLLVKRALPAYAAFTALRYADYKLGHKPSDAAAEVAARTHLAYAAVTDTVPGLRWLTDRQKELVPGPKYGPLAIPLTFAAAAGAAHWGKHVLFGKQVMDRALRRSEFRRWAKTGLLAGLPFMAPFVPGMLGSRETTAELKRQYSGVDMVPVRAGRWWDMGAEALSGGKISYWSPNWYQRWKSRSFVQGIYGDENEYWSHNPLLHPLRWLRDPYWLEKQRYHDRPFPITSPAFANVPIVGDVLAATLGRVVKPERFMHVGEWSDTDYEVGGPKLQPKGEDAKAAERLKKEYSLGHVTRRQTERFFDFIGLPGFEMKTVFSSVMGEDLSPYMQGSRQMANLSLLYYEKQFGALSFVGMDNLEQVGYSEPIRRFITPEAKGIQVNEIRNRMPSWLPGEGEYAIDFQRGDPYSRIPMGYLRLPGPGYEALHPELKGTDPEHYPALAKLSILADVAPSSTKFHYMQSMVEQQAEKDMSVRIELDRILARVEEQKRSAIHAYRRKFSGETEQVSGTVEDVSLSGVRLAEYPGRVFRFSGVGTSAADLAAGTLGEYNAATREQVARLTRDRFGDAQQYLESQLRPGSRVSATIARGAADVTTDVPAVFGGVNRGLLRQGYGSNQTDDAGPEAQALYSPIGRTFGRYAEALAFQGDQSHLNPMRYAPSPYMTKLWNVQTPLEEYLNNEYYGSSSRSWGSPVEDFLGPYARGAAYRLTGVPILSGKNSERRDLSTLTDQMKYLQALNMATADPENRNRWFAQAARTNIGGNLFSSADRVELTLPRRDRPYFEWFREETDPAQRDRILSYASPELARSLSAQWLKEQMYIAQAEGRQAPLAEAQGRPIDPALIGARPKPDYLGLSERPAGTPADYMRADEIAEFFSRKQLHLPEIGSAAYDPSLDYEDVKLQILNNEGYDYRDFGIFQDRASILWRKPYVDGAVRALSQPSTSSPESLRLSVQQMIASSHDRNPRVTTTPSGGYSRMSTLNINNRVNYQPQIRNDIRRNREQW